ncbi:large conductance mechanosensitive channel protein MscL [Streptomyces sp. NPDC090109]|uniref:large conductance mechanosensitive channel protein MscL n=1 Tax=Streptomyces sp. NPDC090109 TaxID=3365948 RepID=UPI0038217430
MKEFRSFILRGNVVGLAVGIVIGAAFTAVVNGFVSAFLTPLVGLAAGATGDTNRKTFTVGATQFPYGAFINAVISFVLLASALYFLVVLPINKLHERLAPHQDVQAPKRGCPERLAPSRARRCASCTAPLPAVPVRPGDTTRRIEQPTGGPAPASAGPVRQRMRVRAARG